MTVDEIVKKHQIECVVKDHSCLKAALEYAVKDIVLQIDELKADLGWANENVSLLLGKLRDQLDGIVKDWSEAFAKHGFFLHPGLTPEQNAKEWADKMQEKDRLLSEYQAAVRKVDSCCNCLAYEPFKDLPRGEKEDPCTDCGLERVRCPRTNPKVSGDACCPDCSHALKRNDEVQRLIDVERRIGAEVRCDCGVPGCNMVRDHQK